MVNQDNGSLFDLLQRVASLPEYMHRDAIKNIVTEWRRKSPLVDEVASGHTTFEMAIVALVEENSSLRYFSYRKGICNSPKFETLAKETRTKFAGIVPLLRKLHLGKIGEIEVVCDLTEPVHPRLSSWSHVLLIVGLPCWGASYFADRGLFALWQWPVVASVAIGLLGTIGGLLIGYPLDLSERRELAQKKLEQAKFLDVMFQKV